jgi:starch phosphorylase
VWQSHLLAKQSLLREVRRKTGLEMAAELFTIGFARRSTEYKRGDLLFQDLDRLKSIAAAGGGLQVIYAGKAHPQDHGGKELIKRIFQAKEALQPEIAIVYVENYDMEFGKAITAGVDLWLNTPLPPREASGTSGMKAAINGVPSLSVLDGWWIEGHIEGVTGWSIGANLHRTGDDSERLQDALSLYDKLEKIILPLFYRDRDRYIDVMRSCLALNGAFFNTQRMMLQYVLRAYL